ncbi:MAG: SAM-dependent methyltransferase [Myxococcota bacterium]
MKKGSLTVVGTGIKFGAHLTPEAQGHIEAADIVYAAAPGPGFMSGLRSLNRQVVDLADHYEVGKARRQIYSAMATAIVDAVRGEHRVCAVFYGHPGVFVGPAHDALKTARSEGYEARMLPGISAEDCLLADLEIDPGDSGCQSYEATHFLLYERRFDPTTPLILWQIGVVGEKGVCRGARDTSYMRVLVELLSVHYPLDHEVVVYGAALIGPYEARVDRLPLAELPNTKTDEISTLYIPPFGRPRRNEAILDRLRHRAKAAP